MGEAEGVIFSEDIPVMMAEIGKASAPDFFERYPENLAVALNIIAKYANAADPM